MTASECRTPASVATLMGYWLGELDADSEADLEAHLFGCAACSARLRQVAQLARGMRAAMRAGRVHAAITPGFLDRLRHDGLRIREYRLGPGESVACTVGPEDDLVVSRLQAPLQDVRKVDLVYQDVTAGTQSRIEDLPFDKGGDCVMIANSMPELRRLGRATLRMQLLAVDAADQRELGTYTFNHSPQ